MSGSQLAPSVVAALDSDVIVAQIETLAATECPALTARRARRGETSGADHDPIVWSRADGVNVWDVAGNRFVDMSAGFGAAAVGHGHSRVVAAAVEQTGRLVHALGDLHPSDAKVRLVERLARLAPWEHSRVMLGLSGSDAIEAALKTAALKTGRPGVLAFEGAYHGLSYGPLAACGYREAFRAPFAAQLNPHVQFVPFAATAQQIAATLAAARAALSEGNIGAVLVEPVLGRAGVVPAAPGLLRELGALARQQGALLVVDEVMTGLGRGGSLFRSLDDGAQPDVVCIGKALGGGFPVSACLASDDVMQAWGAPGHEALHTGTFVGHPVACAAACATLDVMQDEGLAARANDTGALLRDGLEKLAGRHHCIEAVRGVGLLVGVQFDTGRRNLALIRALLERGYIAVPAGAKAQVLSLTPALSIDIERIEQFVVDLDVCVEALS